MTHDGARSGCAAAVAIPTWFTRPGAVRSHLGSATEAAGQAIARALAGTRAHSAEVACRAIVAAGTAGRRREPPRFARDACCTGRVAVLPGRADARAVVGRAPALPVAPRLAGKAPELTHARVRPRRARLTAQSSQGSVVVPRSASRAVRRDFVAVSPPLPARARDALGRFVRPGELPGQAPRAPCSAPWRSLAGKARGTGPSAGRARVRVRATDAARIAR